MKMNWQREKKIVQKLKTNLLANSSVPSEYVLFQFCREFGVTPSQVDEMHEAQYQLFLEFMRAENYVNDIQQKRASQKK